MFPNCFYGNHGFQPDTYSRKAKKRKKRKKVAFLPTCKDLAPHVCRSLVTRHRGRKPLVQWHRELQSYLDQQRKCNSYITCAQWFLNTIMHVSESTPCRLTACWSLFSVVTDDIINLRKSVLLSHISLSGKFGKQSLTFKYHIRNVTSSHFTVIF